MNPLQIIKKYYKIDSKAYKIIVGHSQAVTKKALSIAKKVPHLNPDLNFIAEASMLHDIGIFLTDAPAIECFGKLPYICHGYLGRKIIAQEGFPNHALVCERHVGVGLSLKEIEEQKLPIPKRDMLPISVEEQVICLADKFFSKNQPELSQEKSLDQIRAGLLKYGHNKVLIFNTWVKIFEI